MWPILYFKITVIVVQIAPELMWTVVHFVNFSNYFGASENEGLYIK